LACEAHDSMTEKVQVANELASMWKGEYTISALEASMVIGPGTGSKRR
jgi:hypothetical protein